MEKDNNISIFHLFFAKEGTKARDFYNNSSIDFIKIAWNTLVKRKQFDFIQTIREKFVEFSPGIIVKGRENPFNNDDFISNDEIIKNKIIKFKNQIRLLLLLLLLLFLIMIIIK